MVCSTYTCNSRAFVSFCLRTLIYEKKTEEQKQQEQENEEEQKQDNTDEDRRTSNLDISDLLRASVSSFLYASLRLSDTGKEDK